MTDDIGQWYEDQRKKADNIREKIVQTEARLKASCLCTTLRMCTSCHEGNLLVRQLNRELEQALYVGD